MQAEGESVQNGRRKLTYNFEASILLPLLLTYSNFFADTKTAAHFSLSLPFQISSDLTFDLFCSVCVTRVFSIALF